MAEAVPPCSELGDGGVGGDDDRHHADLQFVREFDKRGQSSLFYFFIYFGGGKRRGARRRRAPEGVATAAERGYAGLDWPASRGPGFTLNGQDLVEGTVRGGRARWPNNGAITTWAITA